MTAPYLDRCGHATDNSGHSFVDPLRCAATSPGSTPRASRSTCTRSATGASARRSTPSRPSPARPAAPLAHLQLIHPDDVRRFGELGVAANMQALWACLDDQMTDLTMPFLGEERSTWQYPFGSLHRCRCPPRGRQRLAGQHAQPARGHPRRGQPLGPWRGGSRGQRTVPPRAVPRPRDRLRGVHQWVGVGEPPRRRRLLAPGQAADLVVLDRDPFAGDVAEIGATRVVSTWVDGVAVHQA